MNRRPLQDVPAPQSADRPLLKDPRTVIGSLLLLPFAAYGATLQWVFFRVWGDWGYWIWVGGGSSTGSW